MSTDKPSAEQYQPLFESILKDATKLKSQQVDAIRELLVKGEGQQAYKVLWTALGDEYSRSEEITPFYFDHKSAMSKLAEMFVDPVFENLVEAVRPAIGEYADIALEAWHHNESEIAWDILVGCVEEAEPTLSPEMQRRFIEFAEGEDAHNQKRWERLNAEMTPEQIKQYGASKDRTDYADELRELFGKTL